MSPQTAVRVVSQPGVTTLPPPLPPRAGAIGHGEGFYALLLTLLTLATSVVALYDLYLLGSNL